MSMNTFPFRDSFGTLEFTCTDCGAHVYSFGTLEFTCTDCGAHVYSFGTLEFTCTDCGAHVCRTCQFIGEHPHLPDEVKALLRGECP